MSRPRHNGKTGFTLTELLVVMSIAVVLMAITFSTVNSINEGNRMTRCITQLQQISQALKMGVTYWDTAEGYGGGKSETGFGKYLGANSDDRKKIFLVTKSGAGDNAAWTTSLEGSLERLQTDYVDLFFLHGIESPDRLTDDVKAWVEKMKKAGKIKFFGFSCHSNMSACLQKAAEVGWVDGVMLTFNFRTMVLDEGGDGRYEKALDAAHKAGIGMTAMKTQAKGMRASNAEAEQALLDAFTGKKFSSEQAALKVVWGDERISCICSGMPNMTILKANVAAALDKTELSGADYAALRRFAEATASDYCAGCSDICGRAVKGRTPVCDVMRYVMYYNAYDDKHEARELFAALPANVRNRLTRVDYSLAESRCPQGIPIAERMKLAGELLA